MFNYLSMIDNYDIRKVDHFDGNNGLIVDTCRFHADDIFKSIEKWKLVFLNSTSSNVVMWFPFQ